jgi:predicted kinase
MSRVSTQPHGTADKVVRGGYTAVVDAVFANASARDAIERVARAAGVPFLGLWLTASERVLISRVEGRGPDASDADGAVVRAQLAHQVDGSQWHRVDASGTRQQVRDDVLTVVQ